MNNRIDEIIAKLNSAKRIAIFCHARPDGDALGSGLALYRMLKNAGKVAYMCSEELPPEKFSFIPAMAEVVTELPDIDYDLLVSVDCADITRMGIFSRSYGKFKGVTVNIDHHVSNDGYAKMNYVCVCPATCEIVTQIFQNAGWEVTEEIANLLMLGLITDSGNFTHLDVSPKTFETAAYLRGKGAKVNEINYYMFSRQTKARALLYGRVMSKMRFALDGKLAYIIISEADMQEFGAEKSLTEGFVDFPLSVDGVEVAASLLEFKEGQYKTSLRSKGNVNVNAIASKFGGGGHVLASGCMLFGSVEDALDELIYAVSQYL